MSNRKLLEDAEILKKGGHLSPEQEQAIEALSAEEVKTLVSVKKKLLDKFPPTDLALPITHHH